MILSSPSLYHKNSFKALNTNTARHKKSLRTKQPKRKRSQNSPSPPKSKKQLTISDSTCLLLSSHHQILLNLIESYRILSNHCQDHSVIRPKLVTNLQCYQTQKQSYHQSCDNHFVIRRKGVTENQSNVIRSNEIVGEVVRPT
ncbi:MAG: hypothetical protein KatS3mg006_0258 [Pyrinomonadaceae bacterium]|nr:MAG: hypothetical protein KatS3mg006_0258 [Pyrinomonadaceae bacterium]